MNIFVIKGNFDLKKTEIKEEDDQKKFEELIAKAGAGSHMVFRSDNEDDELFIPYRSFKENVTEALKEALKEEN